MRRDSVAPEAWTQVSERVCARASVSEFGWNDSGGFESCASMVNASDSTSFWCGEASSSLISFNLTAVAGHRINTKSNPA